MDDRLRSPASHRGFTVVYREGLDINLDSLRPEFRYKDGWQIEEWDHLPLSERPTFHTLPEACEYIDEELP